LRRFERVRLCFAHAAGRAGGGWGVALVAAPGSPLPINAYAMAIADVNSDIIRPDRQGAEHLLIFLGDGSGRFHTAAD